MNWKFCNAAGFDCDRELEGSLILQQTVCQDQQIGMIYIYNGSKKKIQSAQQENRSKIFAACATTSRSARGLDKFELRKH